MEHKRIKRIILVIILVLVLLSFIIINLSLFFHKLSFARESIQSCENLRTIIEITLSENRLPILMTKADNVEGDFSINQDIADLAQEYDLPLWNFWAAIQDLPNHGLVEDGIHLTFYKNDFADPNAFNYAWTYRNLTALQLLEKLMQATEKLQNK
mgnify:CR=1 FL=1